MPFEFRTADPDLTSALRRVAGAEMAAVLVRLEGGAPGPEGVHDVRKRIKKVRGLLRLVRGGMRAARAEITVLRVAAQGLSSLRDAEVMLACHDRLAPGVAGEVRAWLAGRVDVARADEGLPGRVEAARLALAALALRVPGWRVKGRDGSVIGAGLERTMRRAAAAMVLARDAQDEEAMHDWRKRAKDLWYQARLMTPVWPDGMAVWRDVAGDLGELLGDHHDLAVFLALVEGHGGAEVPGLRAQALRMSADLKDRAFALGARLHAAPPEVMAGLWLAWWKVWRAGR
ncbi:MAG: CHAD domain-containing protein [Gemmobacter sp.]